VKEIATKTLKTVLIEITASIEIFSWLGIPTKLYKTNESNSDRSYFCTELRTFQSTIDPNCVALLKSTTHLKLSENAVTDLIEMTKLKSHLY
jgi:hypothetical protein